MKNRFFDKLLWVDIEFTTINYSKAKILEFAAIVTDAGLNEITRQEWVVHQPDEVIEEMKQFKIGNVANKPELADVGTVYDLHERSGLLAKVKQAQLTSEEAEKEVIEFTKQNIGERLVILAGNSIHADRQVIAINWPNFEKLLHYRMIDVSSFKLIYGNAGEIYDKEGTHRAIDDIEESLAELKFYLKGNDSK